MTGYDPTAAVELLGLAVFAWDAALGVFLLTTLAGPDEFAPRGADRAPPAPEARRRGRLCAHAFLRAALAGAFLTLT